MKVNQDAIKDTNEADEAKQKGNTAFKDGQWSKAVAFYSHALDHPVPHFRIFDEGPR